MDNEQLMKNLRTQCLVDGREHVDLFRQALPLIATQPLEALAQIMKACHSLKGDLQAVTFVHCGRFVHDLENFLTQAEAGLKVMNAPLPEDEARVLEFLLSEVVDNLESYLSDLESAPADSEELLQQRQQSLKTLNFWSVPGTASAPAEAPAPSAPPESAETLIPFESPATSPNPTPPPTEPKGDTPAAAPASEPEPTASAAAVTPAPSRHPSPPETNNKSLFLLCRNGAHSVALPIGKVLEVVQSQAWNAIPCSRQGLLGLLNLRGEVLPIVDLTGTFGSHDRHPRTFIVVCRGPKGQFGFPVEEAEQIMELETNSFQPLGDLDGGHRSSLVTHFCLVEERTLMVLDVDRILAA